MTRNEAEHFFGETIPARFRADTPPANDAEVEALLAGSKTFFDNCARYQVVAEIVEASRCMAGVEVGQRYVIQGARIDPAQTTGPLCIFLVSMLVQRVAVAFDRFAREGEMALTLSGAQCTDPGPAVGGFGGVKARLWLEPIPEQA
jgi:hypothetical protein